VNLWLAFVEMIHEPTRKKTNRFGCQHQKIYNLIIQKTSTVSPARVAAFDILRKIEDGAFSSVLLAAKEPELNQVDRALCHELVMGVLRWQLKLDKLIEHFAKRKVTSLDLPVLVASRLALY
jgi:transcription termination factor NusB